MKLQASLPLFLISFVLSISPVQAQMMEGQGTILEIEEYDEFETPSIAPQTTILPRSETLPIPSDTFFIPKQTERTLSAELSTANLDFGILTPTSPTSRTVTLSLTGTSKDVILYTFENHNLRNENGIFIPATSCDTGTCSKHVASTWDSTLSFGLGFSCIGPICDQDFSQTKFRPFTGHLTSFAEGTLGVGTKREITIPVKVNVPATQESGTYTNTVLIMSVPGI